jgi:hypothetical protein
VAAAAIRAAESHWRPPVSAQALTEPPSTPAAHQGAEVRRAARATIRRPNRVIPRPTSATLSWTRVCRDGGTASSPCSTASCRAAQEARGQAAVVGAKRYSTRNRTARAVAVSASLPGVGPAGPSATSASPAAQAARISSELRNRIRAARREKPAAVPARTSSSSRTGLPPNAETTAAPALTRSTAPTARRTCGGRAR